MKIYMLVSFTDRSNFDDVSADAKAGGLDG